jgi:hypothetical protein
MHKLSPSAGLNAVPILRMLYFSQILGVFSRAEFEQPGDLHDAIEVAERARKDHNADGPQRRRRQQYP